MHSGVKESDQAGADTALIERPSQYDDHAAFLALDWALAAPCKSARIFHKATNASAFPIYRPSVDGSEEDRKA